MLFKYYDYSEKAKIAIEQLGFGKNKNTIKQKLLVEKTNFEIKKAQFDATYNQQVNKEKTTFHTEVIQVQMALNNVPLNIEKMTALEWCETAKLAKKITKEHGRSNKKK